MYSLTIKKQGATNLEKHISKGVIEMTEKRAQVRTQWPVGQDVWTVNMKTGYPEVIQISKVIITLGAGNQIENESYFAVGQNDPIDLDMLAKTERTAKVYAKVYRQAMAKAGVQLDEPETKPEEVKVEEVKPEAKKEKVEEKKEAKTKK